jgi:HSP20 family protein
MAKTAKKSATKKKAASKKAASKNAASKKAGKGAEIPVETPEAEGSRATGALAPLADIEKLFDDFLERQWGRRPFQWTWPSLRGMPSLFEQRVPSVDIVEREKEVVVRAEVPGIDKDDLDVSITDRTLTIKGETRHEEKTEQDDFYRHEIRSGTFSRSVLLPADIDAGKASASFKNGVVELKLPKVKASKRQTISVK